MDATPSSSLVSLEPINYFDRLPNEILCKILADHLCVERLPGGLQMGPKSKVKCKYPYPLTLEASLFARTRPITHIFVLTNFTMAVGVCWRWREILFPILEAVNVLSVITLPASRRRPKAFVTFQPYVRLETLYLESIRYGYAKFLRKIRDNASRWPRFDKRVDVLHAGFFAKPDTIQGLIINSKSPETMLALIALWRSWISDTKVLVDILKWKDDILDFMVKYGTVDQLKQYLRVAPGDRSMISDTRVIRTVFEMAQLAGRPDVLDWAYHNVLAATGQRPRRHQNITPHAVKLMAVLMSRGQWGTIDWLVKMDLVHSPETIISALVRQLPLWNLADTLYTAVAHRSLSLVRTLIKAGEEHGKFDGKEKLVVPDYSQILDFGKPLGEGSMELLRTVTSRFDVHLGESFVVSAIRSGEPSKLKWFVDNHECAKHPMRNLDEKKDDPNGPWRLAVDSGSMAMLEHLCTVIGPPSAKIAYGSFIMCLSKPEIDPSILEWWYTKWLDSGGTEQCMDSTTPYIRALKGPDRMAAIISAFWFESLIQKPENIRIVEWTLDTFPSIVKCADGIEASEAKRLLIILEYYGWAASANSIPMLKILHRAVKLPRPCLHGPLDVPIMPMANITEQTKTWLLTHGFTIRRIDEFRHLYPYLFMDRGW